MDKETKDAPKQAPSSQAPTPQKPASQEEAPTRYTDWASI